MGLCIYCHEKAGWFKDRHPDCERKEQDRLRAIEGVRQQVRAAAAIAALSDGDIAKEVERIRNDAKSKSLDPIGTREMLIQGWSDAVGHALDDNVLSIEEENRLVAFSNAANLTQEELDRNGLWTKLGKMAILREVFAGRAPHTVKVNGSLPFNFLRDEVLLWVEPNITYIEEKTKRTYVGGSTGVSVRVMKGVYLRQSAFRGQPVDESYMSPIDDGVLAITNQAVYFQGGLGKAVKVPLKKVVAFTPYSDGFGVCKDGVRARPQIFAGGDGWFLFNLVRNAANVTHDSRALVD